MIHVRKSADRGHFNHDWLDTYHTFSFDQYYDPQYTNFRTLRVINEDRVKPGHGFPTHPHRDMEIVTYVLSGELEHRDNTGGGGVLRHGDVQTMTAGRGILHSEKNPSKTDLVHLLQIWILPGAKGLSPGYNQKTFDDKSITNQLRLIVSPDGSDGSLQIHQDASVYCSILQEGKTIKYEMANDRHAWLQVAAGRLQVNDVALEAGDGAAMSTEHTITLRANASSEFLLFDLL